MGWLGLAVQPQKSCPIIQCLPLIAIQCLPSIASAGRHWNSLTIHAVSQWGLQLPDNRVDNRSGAADVTASFKLATSICLGGRPLESAQFLTLPLLCPSLLIHASRASCSLLLSETVQVVQAQPLTLHAVNCLKHSTPAMHTMLWMH
jgi:hypothetical protein